MVLCLFVFLWLSKKDDIDNLVTILNQLIYCVFFFHKKKKKILGRFCEKEKLLKEKKKEYHQTKFNYDENITVTILFIIET